MIEWTPQIGDKVSFTNALGAQWGVIERFNGSHSSALVFWSTKSSGWRDWISVDRLRPSAL